MTPSLFSTTPRSRGDDPSPLRDTFVDAAGFWERRRVWYNAELALLATGWVMVSWLDFRWALTFESMGAVLRLAGLANVCYCAAYVVDIPLSRSNLKAAWQERRGMLWLLGTVFAVLVFFYWMAHEIDPYVR